MVCSKYNADNGRQHLRHIFQEAADELYVGVYYFTT